MRKIWPHITDQFASAAEVIAAFHAEFPLEPGNEHLAGFVVTELAKGGASCGQHDPQQRGAAAQTTRTRETLDLA
jgi:hypothetical protein